MRDRKIWRIIHVFYFLPGYTFNISSFNPTWSRWLTLLVIFLYHCYFLGNILSSNLLHKNVISLIITEVDFVSFRNADQLRNGLSECLWVSWTLLKKLADKSFKFFIYLQHEQTLITETIFLFCKKLTSITDKECIVLQTIFIQVVQ